MSLRLPLKLALAVMLACTALAFGSAAGAVPNPDYTAPSPDSVVDNFTPQQAGDPPVAGAAATQSRSQQVRATPVAGAAATQSRSQLPITGSDAGQLVLIGGLLVAGGAATMALRRRSAAA